MKMSKGLVFDSTEVLSHFTETLADAVVANLWHSPVIASPDFPTANLSNFTFWPPASCSSIIIYLYLTLSLYIYYICVCVRLFF